MLLKFNNQKGFFSIHFIFFVYLMSIAIISYGFIFYAQKQKDLFRKTCYYDLVNIQTKLVQFEKQLFLLNPESTALRIKLNLLYIELLAAIAAENGPLAAKITIEIQNTIQLQNNLEKIQRSIIFAAEQYLRVQLFKINYDLIDSNQTELKIWRHLLKQNKFFELKRNTIFAVQSDSIGGTAPNYELKNNYELLQQLSIELQSEFSNNVDFQTLHNVNEKFHFMCHVSFRKKETSWELKINQDKFL